MAFGFGFNKQKVLSAAEKFVQQGKLQNAIAEYDKILKHDENDLTVNNTIGDLYARLGDNVRAIESFKKVGDAYAAQGFTVKGIAMYKKITKLQPSVDASLKLAELYTQQGLFNDARAQYLQVAEDFMKSGELDQAVRLFQKVLEMDPENVPMRVKLAEVYIRLGKKKEAWEIFSAAAESLRSRGSLAAAEDILKRMLSLDPGNSYVLLLRGRAALEGDDPKSAIQHLEKAADLDSHPEGLRDLLKSYLQIGNLAKASPIAEKLITVHNDPEGLFLLAEGAIRLAQYHEALEVYTRHSDRLLATDSAKLLGSLHTMIGHVRDDAGALDTLLALLNKAGESTHVNEVTELLAHASVKDGNLARARDLYQMLATTEPGNPVHTQNYQQVIALLEGESPAVPGITAEEGAVIVEELEATAPVIDQFYPDHVAVAVRAAVTDADLFLSYNLPDKAVVPLLAALPQAPRDARLNQRLAALHTRFHRFTEAAVCCRTLESVYHDAGHPEEALRYGDLAARYEKAVDGVPAAALPAPTPAPPATAVVSAPEPGSEPELLPASPQEPAAAAHASPDVPELVDANSHASDLAAEWEDSLTVDEEVPAATPAAAPSASAPDSPEIAETVEEVRFYLEHYMLDQARAGFEKLEALTRDAGILGPLRDAIAKAAQPPDEAADEIEINADAAGDFNELASEPAPAEPEFATSPDLVGYDHGPAYDNAPNQALATAHASSEAELMEHHPEAPAHQEPVASEAGDLKSFVADLEASLGDFPHAEPEAPKAPAAQPLPGWPVAPAAGSAAAPAPAREPAPAAKAPVKAPPAPAVPAVAAASAAAAAAPAMSYSKSPVRPLGAGAQAMHPAESVDLSEMFGELKHELEEDVAQADDDPETHYNLGVAFREMGLLDEAIAELQKVCASIDRGHPFTQTVQTYTWLAQCFLDKGVPEAAIRWYEKALQIPGLDQESRNAIHYELGSACESAHDKDAALHHFTAVYGANIDYRDVAERIQALKS